MKKAVIFFSVFLFAGALAPALETQKTMSLSSAGVGILDVDAGAGSLAVVGKGGADTIEVRALIRVTGIREKDLDRYLEDHLELSLKAVDGRAVLVAKFNDRGFSLVGRDARVDLEVNVPRTLALEIDDGSGGMKIENIAAPVRVDDGSGEIVLKMIEGDVRIDDGSGDIRIEGITGALEIDDSSGEIDVREVSGDVLVDDGSGSMTIRHIGGTVTVSDGSGSIDIDDVGGDVRLRSTGGGGVDVSNVKGRVIR
jgi:hypothetical protein